MEASISSELKQHFNGSCRMLSGPNCANIWSAMLDGSRVQVCVLDGAVQGTCVGSGCMTIFLNP